MDLHLLNSLKSTVSIVRPVEPLAPLGKSAGGSANFQQVLGGILDDVKSSRHDADRQVASFLNGEQTDIHQVATSIQKAELTFELAIEVRNKMMQAYQEVMRMQV